MSLSYADLNVPGPTTIPLTEPFWAAAEKGQLLVQHCRDCGRANLYPRALCPHCWGDRLEWRQASGTGRLKSFSIVHKPGHPGWQPVAPYIVGLVTLAEGPTMLSLILPGDRVARVGEPLALSPTNIGGRVLPTFRITQ